MKTNKKMTVHLKIWRQRPVDKGGRMVDYSISDISPDSSFLEMLDLLN